LGQQNRPERPALESPPRGSDPEMGGGAELPHALRRQGGAHPPREPPDPGARRSGAVIDERTDEQRRESLCRAVGELGAQGWCQGTGGTFSLTVSRDPLRLLITRSGVDKRRLQGTDLMLIGPAGEAAPG